MARPKGYLLPENIDPVDDRCLLVYIPDDVAYWRAFWGAYEYLAYWFAWERDELKQGKDAARRWRSAVMRTHETWDELGDFCDMEITVNVNQECCDQLPLTINLNNQIHVEQTVINEILALPGGVIDDGQSAPTPDWPTYTEYQDDKCKIAWALAEDFHATLGNLATFGAGMAGLGASAQQAILAGGAANSLVAGLMAVGLSLYAAMSAMLAILFAVVGIGAFAFGYFANLYNQISFDELVCAFYDAQSEAQAIANIQDLVTGWGTDAAIETLVGGARFLDLFQEIVDLLLAPELLAALFGLTGMLETMTDQTCPNCIGVVPGNDYGTWTLNIGDLAGDSPNGPYYFWTELNASCHRVQIFFNHDGGGYLSADTATITDISFLEGHGGQCGGTPRVRCYDQAANVIFTADTLGEIVFPIENVARLQSNWGGLTKISVDWTM